MLKSFIHYYKPHWKLFVFDMVCALVAASCDLMYPVISRNIINTKGAETLPRYGFGYYLTPKGCELIKIPMTPPEAIAERVQWWEAQKPHKSIFDRIAARR